jgi:hypothetical protein
MHAFDRHRGTWVLQRILWLVGLCVASLGCALSTGHAQDTTRKVYYLDVVTAEPKPGLRNATSVFGSKKIEGGYRLSIYSKSEDEPTPLEITILFNDSRDAHVLLLDTKKFITSFPASTSAQNSPVLTLHRLSGGRCVHAMFSDLGDKPAGQYDALIRLLTADAIRQNGDGKCTTKEFLELSRIAFCRQRNYLGRLVSYLAVADVADCQKRATQAFMAKNWTAVRRAFIGR